MLKTHDGILSRGRNSQNESRQGSHSSFVEYSPENAGRKDRRNHQIKHSPRHEEKFPFLREIYWGTESIWSGGYFVSTVGVNEDIIRRYIEIQGQEDTGQAKLEF